MSVLVTGGAGFIGSHTAVVLHESGRDVVILDDLSNSSTAAVDAIRSLTRPDLPFVEADAADRDAVGRAIVEHGVDEVIHFAAFKSVSESVEKPLAYYSNNVGSTIGVVEAMIEHGVSRLVFSSSCTVYGEPEEVPVTEASPTRAANPYGATKLVCEQLLADVAAASALDVIALRYFNPVGAHPSGDIGEDPTGVPTNLVPLLMQVAVGRRDHLDVFGGDYDTPDGSAVRDYIHVMDLAHGHVAALDTMAALGGCTAVNLGTGKGHSVLEVVAAANDVIGTPIPTQVVGRRSGDVERIWADPTLAAKLLGWRATRGLNEMLADHWRWQQQHPGGYQ
ncbi:MAG: UDP-glucose 4-epimerase GalE [Acidimicrobiales bacterium]|jgi:UDP-glucose 4-epimerase|nr:UDP-glucose 4-epimerase GalE [Acidimicrobiales bacterium]